MMNNEEILHLDWMQEYVDVKPEVKVELDELKVDTNLISIQYPEECIKQEIEYDQVEGALESSCSQMVNVKNEFDINYPESGNEEEQYQQEHLDDIADITIKDEIEALAQRDAQRQIDELWNPTLKVIPKMQHPHKCQFCTRSFPTKYRLKNHQRTHTGEKPYSCPHCARSFTRISYLTSHKKTHSGEKPFSCEICNALFTWKSCLIAHQRTHTGEKPYSCEICNDSFPVKSRLIIHRRKHTGERPYSCAVCGDSFSHKSKLTIHQRIHTGEKPYWCDICERGFALKSNLTSHQRVHTGEKPYCCEGCTRSFAKKYSLQMHRIHCKKD